MIVWPVSFGSVSGLLNSAWGVMGVCSMDRRGTGQVHFKHLCMHIVESHKIMKEEFVV